ncbi:transposon Ty3-I Gag-Pol polyprotein [Trichonephila clavipes]|uniref:Transposon Ty3-I Gag-Pol polyprotein n=1 Tax=Trichonephila clavipes TaxID=2585209 RepID=A0A8X6W280_TRICX|nr:transposon Ty3-I Gag-Pol polyprotein [Trichonephila clavipes]
MLKVADGNFVRPIGKCVLRVRINNRELPFEFIVLSHCSHDVILGWDFLEASQAVIDCGQNELVLEDICRDSTAPDAWNLYATRDYILKPHSLTRISVSGYQTRGDINVVLDGSKHLLFEKNIATPSMVSTYRNGKSDVWVTNLQFRNQIIPRGMCIGQAEPLNEGHLCVISDTSGCLDDQQETSESRMNCSLMMSPELSDEQRNKLSELLRKFSGLFTKTDKSTAAKTNVKHRIFTGVHAPINQRAYRVSPTERRIIHEEVQKMLDEGIVQRSANSAIGTWAPLPRRHGSLMLKIADSRQGCGSSVVKVSDYGRYVMSSHPVPPKSRSVGQRCTLNLSRELKLPSVGVVARRWGCQLRNLFPTKEASIFFPPAFARFASGRSSLNSTRSHEKRNKELFSFGGLI